MVPRVSRLPIGEGAFEANDGVPAAVKRKVSARTEEPVSHAVFRRREAQHPDLWMEHTAGAGVDWDDDVLEEGEKRACRGGNVCSAGLTEDRDLGGVTPERLEKDGRIESWLAVLTV